jgi:alpha-amylase
MQWAYYVKTKELEPIVKESKDKEFLRIWRYLLASDHLYYMFTAGGAPGEVHNYFAPYNSPVDAFIAAQGAVLDFESRLKLYVIAANEPFLFYTSSKEESFTGIKAWSLMGLIDTFGKAAIKSIEFHNKRGDFEKWANLSLRDEELSDKFQNIRLSNSQGEKLRLNLYEATKRHFMQLEKMIDTGTRYF